MAQYTERLWTQTKDTEQLTFIAGADLPFRELVKETGPNTNIVIVAADQSEAIGYVLSPKGALAGQKVDIHMLSSGTSTPGTGTVTDVEGINSVVTTPSPITGSGTVELVNDDPAPAPDSYYGTDGIGTKGFFPLPPGGSGSNVTNFDYDTATETATITTDQPGSFPAVFPLSIQNAIHVSKNGNDANALASTTAPYSFKNMFLTIEAAYAASTPNDTIVIWPGKYTLTSTMLIDFTKAHKFYCMPGVQIGTNSFQAFEFIQPGRFYFNGNANFSVVNYVFSNSSGDLVYLYGEFDYALEDNSGNGASFADLTNIVFDLRCNRITNLGFENQGWAYGFFGIDEWRTSNVTLLSGPDPTGPIYDLYGPAKLVFGGRTQKKGLLIRDENASPGTGIKMLASDYPFTALNIEFNFDIYWINGNFIDHNSGTFKLNGHIYPTKSNSLGNELPWYNAQPTSASRFENTRFFIHNGNSVNRKYKPSNETQWYLNNTAYYIAGAGEYHINGQSQVLGASDNGVAGDFPVIKIQNEDNFAVNVTLDGVFKTGAPLDATINDEADVGPIELIQIFSAKMKVKHKDVILVSKSVSKYVAPFTVTNGPVPIQVYHSLVIDQPLKISETPIEFSFDRTSTDVGVDIEIEGYGQ